MLAATPVVSQFSSDSGDAEVVAAYASEPVTLADVSAETTSTTAAQATTSTTVVTTTTAAPPTTQAPTTTAPPVTAAPTTAAPTTAPPATAPPTTAAPTTTVAPTTTAPPATTSTLAYSDPRSSQVWHDLAECESGGNWSINSGNGYYGGLQFSLGSWRNVGGTGYPHEHPAKTQIEMGRRLQAAQGWDAWPHCASELGLR